MRRLVLPLLAACAEHHVPQKPLPPLLASAPPAVAVGEPRVIPGEHMVWEVATGGVTIGRAEMFTDDQSIASKFATDGFASMFADVHHELTTAITRGQPYTLHSAIAWIRGWHPHDTRPAKLFVDYDGDRYTVVCEPPVPDEVHDQRAVRVACRFDAREAVALTLELADDMDRAPLRVLARIGSLHVEADLIARDFRGARATPVPPTHASAP
jgi:hypothetical protein